MDINKYNALNEIYEPLNRKMANIYKEIKNKGYKVSNGWYNMHSVKYKKNFLIEFFPIPVITIEDIGEIGVDLDSIFLETTISKEKALNIDYDALIRKYSIEVYGADDYLTDFYNSSMSSSDIKTRIQNSSETQIHIATYLSKDANVEKILKILLEING